MEQRLEKLELKVMSAEDQLDELNRVVWRQQQEIDLLRQHVRLLAEQLKSVQPGTPLRPEDEIPPHW
ncbi:MAG: SlyX family protein [Thauera phenolivorans]|uniref:SlyX family protein n=1 Tax=Thauera phenolivorans TaxID=1792543 RepID=A0A7X7LYC1_9RHOO|nr:SlyX family protein [Thauera phenolivorans]NLF55131.1 SlyX family protein [Thauera phenolivorans]